MKKKIRVIGVKEHEERSEIICTWLGDHPHLSRSSIAAELGMRPQNFHEAIRGDRKIPKNKLVAIENILKDYGFKSKEYDT